MAYEKHTWENGEVITAEKLNHLEGGVEANSEEIFWVTFGGTLPASPTCDKTYQEIADAMAAGKKIVGFVNAPESNMVTTLSFTLGATGPNSIAFMFTTYNPTLQSNTSPILSSSLAIVSFVITESDEVYALSKVVVLTS